MNRCDAGCEKDWDIRERLARLAAARLIVFKIGSAVLADPDKINTEILNSLACQIAQILQAKKNRRVIIVSSGAVAAGRAVMAGCGIGDAGFGQIARQALAAIGQGMLMQAWNEAFGKMGLATAQALMTRDDFRSRERFQHATDTFSQILDWGVVPIVNENDTVAVHELKFGDNDCLASLLVNLVEADLFVNLTSAGGVLAANPQISPDARVMRCIPDIFSLDIKALCGAKTAAGSGGMHSKLLAARRVAQLGVPTLILPGRAPDVLLDAFGLRKENSLAGTWVHPSASAIPRRKYWLAYQSEPAGSVEIDAGAWDALAREGRSLLPAGIIAVKGDFAKGDLLSVIHAGEVVGVGFSNYASEELGRIYGRKRHEVAAILGEAKYPDVIHRDNLLLDAAV